MNLIPKAALKTHALQTLRAREVRPELASAFGVRASLAPLFLRGSPKVRFRDSTREHLRGIFFSSEREGTAEYRLRMVRAHRLAARLANGARFAVRLTTILALPFANGEGRGEGLFARVGSK